MESQAGSVNPAPMPRITRQASMPSNEVTNRGAMPPITNRLRPMTTSVRGLILTESQPYRIETMQTAMLGSVTRSCTVETATSGYDAAMEAIAGEMHAEAESCNPMASTGIAKT